MSKVQKFVLAPILALLLLLSMIFIDCSNKDNNAHSANSIPDSNVYEDIAHYVQTNGQLDEFGH